MHVPARVAVFVCFSVAVWVTNNPEVQNLVKTDVFPAWELEHVATVLWAKTTSNGSPVFPLRSSHRKPFELCFIGASKAASTEASPSMTPSQLEAFGLRDSPVPVHLLLSVPTRHSVKPRLDGVFGKIVPDFDTCGKLELFARNLRKGWCSVGDQVCHHQAIGSCFTKKV